MKRLLVFALAMAMVVGLHVGTVSAHQGTVDQSHKMYEQQIDRLLNDLLRQLFGQIPVPVNPEKPSVPGNETPALPSKNPPASKQPATQGLTADEQQMVSLVNQERQKQGLSPLKVNMELVKVARVKAQDMIDKNYFDHHSPTYGSPADMLNNFGISYRTMGENLAGHSSVQGGAPRAHEFPGHRANILKGDFTEVGIGVVNGGPYGKMFVQLFIGK